MTSVYAMRVATIDQDMKRLLEMLELPVKATNIGIKIAMCDYRRSETGATTDPIVLGALVGALQSKYPSCEISLFENDASGTNAESLFPYLGIDGLAQRYNCRRLSLAETSWVTKKIDGLHFKQVKVPALVEDFDLIINHPKLKTHGLTKITCGLKNMFGCYKEKRKVKYHKFLDEAIVDMNLAIKSDVTVVDALICMEGMGAPAYGIPRKLGLLIASKDLVAADSFCARLAGFRPWFIGHIRKAAGKGVGKMSYTLQGDLNPADMPAFRLEFNRALYYLLKLTRRGFKLAV